MKTAIIYHYFEANKTYKDNFIFFLNCAIEKDAQYFVFISGNCSVDLPRIQNVKFFFIENKNNDFGAVVEFYKMSNSYTFDSYVFVNSSVRGPFLPLYYKKKWYEVFTLQLSDEIGLIGSTINILPTTSSHSKEFQARNSYTPPFVHVQTTAYALSSKAYKVLGSNHFYKPVARLQKNQVITDYEILMSQILINSGFTISSLLPTLSDFKLDQKYTNLNNTSRNGDVLFKEAFYNRTLSPYECLFLKTNRNMISEAELHSHTFTTLYEKKKYSKLDANGSKLLNEALEGSLLRNSKLKSRLMKIKISLPKKIIQLLCKISRSLIKSISNTK